MVKNTNSKSFKDESDPIFEMNFEEEELQDLYS